MLFNVTTDLGYQISGYLVTDSYSASGRIVVCSGGRSIASLNASEPLPHIATAGRHETGRCGFTVDENIVPGLRAIPEVEIREADTGLLIYRRAPDTYLPDRLVRLETHLVGPRRVDRAMSSHFCYSYLNADRAGFETMSQIFHFLHVRSLYLAARFFYRSFEHLIEPHWKMICIVHDPFEELAERLLLLRQAAKRGRLDARDLFTFSSAIEFAAELQLTDERKLRTAFRRISPDAAGPLQNPLVRQLTVTNPQDAPRRGALAAALTVLASCAVVGLRTESETFALALSAVLGSEHEIVPVVPRCTAAIALADRLRRIPAVTDLLEMDLELYQRVVEAYRKAAAGLSIPGGSGYFPAQ